MNASNKITHSLRASTVVVLAVVTALVAFVCAAVAPATSYADTITYEPGVSDDVTTLTVSKRDASTLERVEGAKLAIIDKSSGKELVTWVTSKEDQTFKRYLNEGTPLNVGTTYILRELEVPEGYELAADTEFHIDDYGSVVVESGSDAEARSGSLLYLYDTKLMVEQTIYKQASTDSGSSSGTITTASGKAPQTDDDAVVIPFIVVAVIGLIAIAGIQIYKRRKLTK